MSTLNEDATDAEAEDGQSRTVNCATDGAATATEYAPSPPSSSPSSPTSESAALTSPASISTPGIGTVDGTDDSPDEDEEDDVSTMASSPTNNPSIATVTAIVNEVLRKKELGARGADIASIASKEVDKFYDDGRLEEEDDIFHSLPPPSARPPTAARPHPWNMKGEDAKALFGRGRDKIKAAIGGNTSNNKASDRVFFQNQEMIERGMYNNTPSFSPPANMFNRKTPNGDITMDENSPDFNDLCEELGITPQTHPQLRSPYRRFNISPESIARSTKCQYCMILTCLVGIAMTISSAVTQGFEHAQKRNHELNPKWVKEEKANEDKEWWVENNGTSDDNKAEEKHFITEMEIIENTPSLTKEELEQMYYEVSDAYLPVWFDRSTGWRGNTFKEAMEFCKSHDDFVPCPYEVYCPGRGNRLIFDEVMEEHGLSWAPIIDNWNEWVQVGNGARQCQTYMGRNKRRPDWGSKGAEDSEKLTRHIMCCLEQPLGDDFTSPGIPTPPDVAKEHGEGVDDPIPPPPPHHNPPPSDVAAGMKEDTTGPAFVRQQPDTFTTFDEEIRDNYRPFWFDDNDGWKGTTWDDGKAFCNSIPNGPNGETFHLCPTKAYCPNGYTAEKPLVYQMDAFGGGEQWAPTSDSHNDWVMVGKASEEQLMTCMTFLELYHKDPEWGTTGSETHSKQHILCCAAKSGYDGGIKKEDFVSQEEEETPGASQSPMQGMPTDLPIVQITPTDIVATTHQSSSQSGTQALGSEDESHNGAGNSSPHAGDHNFEDTINAMKKTLNPTWYSSIEGGWTGGSHSDALKFCKEKEKELCPIEAVCPHGPTFPALEGAWLTDEDEPSEQWAPTINMPNKWLLIGTLDGNESTECMDYETLNAKMPLWGFDGSMPELKRHILCCSKYSALSQTEVVPEAPTESPNYSAPQASEEASSDEETYADGPEMVGTWFHVDDGWNAGSHDDAMHFCAQTEINRKKMGLCPYHMYCPYGPSQPPNDGHGKIGDGEEPEQWAPTSNGDNQWVMVGMHGHNKATQCLTHAQLNGAAPSWGQDTSNTEKKQHIMCCTLSQ